MAESSDMCCQSILRFCQAARLVPALVAAAVKDKNSRIRSMCCGYVALVSEGSVAASAQ
jgi:hypothetical protein